MMLTGFWGISADDPVEFARIDFDVRPALICRPPDLFADFLFEVIDGWHRQIPLRVLAESTDHLKRCAVSQDLAHVSLLAERRMSRTRVVS